MTREYGKPNKPTRPAKPTDELPFEEEGVSQLLIQGGSTIRVVPGTYKELRPSGKDEIFVAQDPDAPGHFVCGPTKGILAIWFTEVKPEVTEPPVTT